MLQTLMICIDVKLLAQQIWSPHLYCCDNSLHLLLICRPGLLRRR
ncbi:unnamed protein product [Linum tenue]|uniref:Uncharacterized protein n=1 Tax=Linum tenue TaxID=586396 RepID=A0AAV0QVY3_9ROSI|nr:unnamed protein product [Linum tenue]